VAAVAVTAGYMTEDSRPGILRHIDAAHVDLKGFSEEFYHRHCYGQLAPVLDTLKYLRHETDVWLEVTTLLIPGENDSEAEIEKASAWFAANLGPDVPWHFTAFHPITRCSTSRPRRQQRSRGRAPSRAPKVCVTFTRQRP